MYYTPCLGDPLNLRDFISTITDHIRDNGTTGDKPRSIHSFLAIVTKGLPLEPLDASILLIQKVLAGSVSYSHSRLQELSRVFCDGDWDEQLAANLEEIQNTIFRLPNADNLFNNLSSQMSIRFFRPQERARLRLLQEKAQYSEFLLGLLKHGFSTLYNLPAFASERLYNEAQTVDYDNPRRYGILKNAAELGHVSAALEVGNYLTKRGTPEEAYFYLSLALPLPAAVWNITFMLENHSLTAEQFQQFYESIDIDRKLSTNDFSDCRKELDAVRFETPDTEKRKELEYAYKVYFWLAYNDFFKGYNSLYKLLRRSDVIVMPPYTKDTLQQKYLERAIASGEITAASNHSSALLNEYLASSPENPMNPDQEEYFRELAQLCSDRGELRGPFNMARYLTHRLERFEDTSITYEDIRRTYELALILDVDNNGVGGYLPYNLAMVMDKISDNSQMDRKKKIELYDAALKKGLDFAAYDKAKQLFLVYNIDSQGKDLHLLYEAQQVLEKYMDKLKNAPDEIRKKPEELLQRIRTLTGI